MKKRVGIILSLAFLAFSLFAERGNVTILYTNDVHTYIANTVKDKSGNKVPGLRYGSIAAMRDELKAQGKEVAVVDAGDHVQGTAYGAMDNGASIIKIMNAVGYDVATLGNHEFDYGAARVFEIMKEAKFPYVACNFLKTKNNKPVTAAFKVIKYGKTKIAFVGIMTPETYTKSTPAYFMDEKQEKFIYKISAGEDGKELYEAVQKAINKASKKADYVVALGHLGIDPTSSPWTSKEVIANTYGLDAFIDGHSHNTVPQEIVKDAKGNNVVLTQTGSYLAAIGKMTLAGDKITSELVTSYDKSDATVDAIVNEWAKSVDDKLNEEIAILDAPMYINDPANPKTRLIRKQETNLGDFVPDGAYYYFNEVEKLDCDMAIGNGGGIRVDVPAGSYTYNSAKKVQPFGNVMCLVQMTGKEVLDFLEFGARKVGVGENGGFIHVAGCKFTVDTSIPDSCKVSAEGLWTAGPASLDAYRVKDVQFYNRKDGTWEALDLNKKYSVAGVNYTLRLMGDGFAMLGNTVLLKDYCGEDYLVSAEYAKSFAKGADGKPHISSKNSPLASYKNYPIDYENPAGSGRITIK